MKRLRFHPAMLACVFLVPPCTAAHGSEAASALAGGAAPSVRWGGAAGPNMTSGARGLPADISGLRPLWEIRLGTHQYSIPTVDRGRIYIGTDDAGLRRPGVKPSGGGLLTCADQATGRLLWQLPSPRYLPGVVEPYHFDQWRCGFCSGPVVDGDEVYVIGNRGEVLCLDREGQANGNQGPFTDELSYMGAAEGSALLPTDGDIVWRYDLLRELDIVPHDVCGSTILLHGDLLYACTSNGIDGPHSSVPRPRAPSLIVLHKRTGKLVAVDGENIGERMLHGHWSSPCLGSAGGRTLVYFGGGDGVLYAFEPAEPGKPDVQILKKAWTYDCNPPDYRSRDGRPVPYSRHNQNSPEGPSEIIGTPVFQDGRVHVTIGQSPIHGVGQGLLACVDGATGKEVWTSRLVDRTLSTVAIRDGLLFVIDYTGRLHCFDAGDGRRLWWHDLEGRVWGASPFVADGKVYAGTESNVLWVLRAARDKEVLSQCDLESVPITPAAVDGVLYVPTQKKLYAFPGASPDAAAPAG